MGEEKNTRIAEIENDAEARVVALLASYTKRNDFLRTANSGNIEELYHQVLGEDHDELVELLDDNADAIDQLVTAIIKRKSPKG